MHEWTLIGIYQMARKLQDRLALAKFKTKRGWEFLDIDAMEPHIEQELRLKRPMSSAGTVSDSSSNHTDHNYLPDQLSSPPLNTAVFSDELYRADGSSGRRQRTAFQSTFIAPHSKPGPNKRARVRAGSMAAPSKHAPRTTWKSTHNLPESSPVYHRQHAHFPVSHGANLSFVSTSSTIPDSPTYGIGSDGEDQELPLHSFQLSSSLTRSSPPRTPPPNRVRAPRPRKANPVVGRDPAIGEEGADLLLYLATSPSPANPVMRARVVPPSTPPSHHTPLPSSMMSTPGGAGFLTGFGTPGQQFNFADFVNITPSPAQGAWGGSRTPNVAKTPLAAREARRRLNFDSLLPPAGGSPNLAALGRHGGVKETGLGMELGGDLIP